MDTADTERVIELGDYCELLFADPRFNLVVSLYEHHQMQSLLATKPEEGSERERIYSRFNGLREFLGHMQVLVKESRAARPPEPIDPETTPVQELPDDVVFDIYRAHDADTPVKD